VVDLAADLDNALVYTVDREVNEHVYVYLGPGSLVAEDALLADWHALFGRGPGFLNPPFSKTLSNAYRTGRIKNEAGVWIEHEKDPVKATWYEVERWAEKCWREGQKGFATYGIFPYAPQTEWFRRYVCGHVTTETAEGPLVEWAGYAADEERRIPHRISFLRPDGSPAANAGVNSCVIIWNEDPGYVGPWQPAVRYWSYR
jgi:hypothetical protein